MSAIAAPQKTMELYFELDHAKDDYMYDVIGDVHGHADELVELLGKLGYRDGQGFYSHPNRTAVFVGDFIDRGPQILEVLRLARAMIDNDAALAVMGNHEFNAIAYHTVNPQRPGCFFRDHSDKNNHQHAETLRQVPTPELSEFVEWFKSLPVALDLDGLQVVHASWDRDAIETIERSIKTLGPFTSEFLTEVTASEPANPLFQAVEEVLKGKEVQLPDGLFFRDKDGHPRHHMRVRWFESPKGQSFRGYTMPRNDDLPDDPIPLDMISSDGYGATEPPVFFGHYWLNDNEPKTMAPNVACVDYSVAKNGLLCAYRWNADDAGLKNENFVTVKSKS
ncbi:MAG: metallophosphoesterase [Candidatus Hydrogenedentota bacterium]